MLEKDCMIKVTNRYNGTVGYSVPDLNNLHRNFMPKESKEITMEELRKLSYLPGGRDIMKECLIIENQDALNELLGNVEPEYFYTEDEIKKLLKEGTIEQFMDCLDFAPDGVIELIKSLAVSTEVNDIRKRDAILNKTGFNVTKAIEINKETLEKDEENVSGITRRAAPISGERRAIAPKYKVVETK